MNAEIIAIGTELLLGFIVNTDTAFLGRVLAELGIDCYHQVTVGDNPKRLGEAIRTALGRADLVITCGGLGPTVDDVTLETIARVTGCQLVLRQSILREIRRRFIRQKIRMPASNRRQALIPEGAVVFPNQVGTAPGFLLLLRQAQGERTSRRTQGKRLLVALPGPPTELMPMVKSHLIPRLRRYAGSNILRSRTLKITGVSESEVDSRVADLLALKGSVTVGIYAHPGQVDLRITARGNSLSAAQQRIAQVERKIRKRLGPLIFGADDETLEGVVGRLLKKRSQTLGVAESCTGGLLAHRITEVPGSSSYFRGGIVAYSNELKGSTLSVRTDVLKNYGAVSAPAACAMAEGARRLTGSDLGIAITGIAGPTGATKNKPIGLTHIALSISRGVKDHRCLFSGDRSTIKFKASQAALNLLRLHLLSEAAR